MLSSFLRFCFVGLRPTWSNFVLFCLVFTARRYASAYMLSLCSYMYVCVCLSHAGIVAKWLNVELRKQLCMIAQGLIF